VAQRKAHWALLFVGGAAIAGIAGWEIVHGRITVATDDQERIARGRVIYGAQCASCHGANREGQPNWQQPLADGGFPAPPQDASGHTWHHSDTELFVIVRDGGELGSPGASRMPAFGKLLGDDDIVTVLSYIKSEWPIEIRAAQERLNHRSNPEHMHH
jgi:mono/diheme cytochrome c family protein